MMGFSAFSLIHGNVFVHTSSSHRPVTGHGSYRLKTEQINIFIFGVHKPAYRKSSLIVQAYKARHCHSPHIENNGNLHFAR